MGGQAGRFELKARPHQRQRMSDKDGDTGVCFRERARP
jgi:hypothetical protein